MRFFKALRPCFLGLLFIHIWIYCTTHRSLPYGSVSIMTVMYLALSLSLLAMVFALNRRPAGFQPSRWWDLLAGVCMASSSVLLALPLPLPADVAAFVGAALGGLGVGWTYGRWIGFYVRLDIHLAAPLVFLSMALGSLGKTVVDLLPPLPATIVLVCAPLLAYLTLYRSQRQAPEAPEPARYFNDRTLNSLWRLVVGVVVFSLTVGIMQSMPRDMVPVPRLIYPLIIHGGEILFALALLWWVEVKRRGVNFSQTWSLILLLIVTALIFAPYYGDTTGAYIYECIGIAQTALIIVLFLAIADIARHSTFPPMVVFACGWFAYSLPYAVGDVIGSSMRSFQPYGTMIVYSIVWVLVLVTLFFLNDSAVGRRLIFTELNDDEDDDSPSRRVVAVQRNLDERADEAATDATAARCRVLAEQAGLTPRECEILDLLARGRSRSYIADAFFISENTVHGHVKRVYEKLDVHSKQELIDRVEGTPVAPR